MEITPEFMYECYKTGVLGTKEFRGWLASHDPTFAQVRDSDVDNEIDRLARERSFNRAQEIQEQQQQLQLETDDQQ